MGGTSYGITMSPTASGRRWPKMRDLLIETPQNYASIALKLHATKGVGSSNKILDRINIKAYESGTFEGGAGDLTAGSKGLQLSAAASGSFHKCSFGHIAVSGFEEAFLILVDGSGTEWKYINGNHFDFLNLSYSKYPFVIRNTSTSSALVEVAGNVFAAVDIQPCLSGTESVDAITLAGSAAASSGISSNDILNVCIWDWGVNNGYCVKVTGNASNAAVYRNLIQGRYTINGAQGVFDDYGATDGYKRYYKADGDAWVQTPYGYNFFEKVSRSWSGDA